MGQNQGGGPHLGRVFAKGLGGRVAGETVGGWVGGERIPALLGGGGVLRFLGGGEKCCFGVFVVWGSNGWGAFVAELVGGRAWAWKEGATVAIGWGGRFKGPGTGSRGT